MTLSFDVRASCDDPLTSLVSVKRSNYSSLVWMAKTILHGTTKIVPFRQKKLLIVDFEVALRYIIISVFLKRLAFETST